MVNKDVCIIYLYAAVAEVTNIWTLRSTYCRPTEANYWQTRSVARPLYDSRAMWLKYVSNGRNSKTNCPKIFWLSWLEIPKDIATKSGETHVRDRTLLLCKFSRWSARGICPRAKKYIFFSYRGLPWGLPPYAIHFWKALVEPMLRPIWHVTLRFLTFSRYSQSKFGILGPLVGTPKGEKTCPGLISTIVQHFTPIGGTFAEISVTGHIQI